MGPGIMDLQPVVFDRAPVSLTVDRVFALVGDFIGFRRFFHGADALDMHCTINCHVGHCWDGYCERLLSYSIFVAVEDLF